ncbi:phosphorylase family protein [Chelatococcus reniformis]|nr:phosphorylase [Chelatococcus reniformis]
MTAPAQPSLLFVCGLAREAGIAAGEGARAICGDAPTLQAGLGALPARPDLVVSFGLCGGLDPALRSGDLVVGTTVAAAGTTLASQEGLGRVLVRRLASLGQPARLGVVAAVDAPVLTWRDKARLREATGAIAVDMESLVAARFAAECGLPFVVLRAVSDPADRDLPPLVLKAVGADGRLDLKVVAAAVARSPAQIGGLVAAGLDSAAAFAALGRVRRLPGLFLSLGLADL